MSFGLPNAPTVFIGCMDWIFRPYLNKFMVIFIDDYIFIYSKTEEAHEEHLKIALQILRRWKLYASYLSVAFG